MWQILIRLKNRITQRRSNCPKNIIWTQGSEFHQDHPSRFCSSSVASSSASTSLASSFSESEEHVRQFGTKHEFLSRYGDLELIGRGGQASGVWKALDTQREQRVAVKIYCKNKMSPQLIEAAYREIKIAQSVQHTNILSVYEVFEDEKHLILVSNLMTCDLH